MQLRGSDMDKPTNRKTDLSQIRVPNLTAMHSDNTTIQPA